MSICILCSFQRLIGFDGFYIGGSAGCSLLDGRHSRMGMGTLTTGATNIYRGEHSSNFFDENFDGGLYTGFGFKCRALYLGVEAFGKYTHLNARHQFQNNNIFPDEDAAEGIFSQSKVNLGPWQYGVDFRPGILLTPQTLLYARFGFAGTKIKFKNDITNSLIFPNNSFDIPLSTVAKKHGHFLRVGLGMEQFLCSRLALRWDYVFTNYRSLSIGGNRSGTLGPFTLAVIDSNKLHLKTHELKLGLSYYFCPYPEYHSQMRRCVCGPNYCGPYLGVSLGGGLATLKHHTNSFNIAPGPESVEEGLHPFVVNNQFNDKSVRTLVFGGYGLQWDCCLMKLFGAVEVFGQYSPYFKKGTGRKLFIDGFNAPLFTANTTLMGDFKLQPWQYGVQLRPGIVLNPSTLLFGTVGFSIAKIDFRYKALFENPVASVSLELPNSFHSTRAVLRVGGGLEYVLCKKWHARADYVFTNYRSFNLEGSRAFDFGPPLGTISLSNETSFHMKDHAATLGLVRYF